MRVSGLSCANVLALVWVACSFAVGVDLESVGHVNVNVHSGEQKHQRQVHAYASDDAAQATFRFCAETGIADLNSIKNVAKDMQNMLDQKKHQPPIKPLRTAGAYSRRAGEHVKAGRYLEAGADLTRALLRPGLDEDQSQKLHEKLQHTMQGAGRQLERQQREQEQEQMAQQLLEAERQMAEESKKQLQEQEGHWDAWMAAQQAVLQLGEETHLEDPLASLQLTITKGEEQTQRRLECCSPEHKHAVGAAVRFALRYELYSGSEVLKLTKMLSDQLRTSGAQEASLLGDLGSAEAYSKRAAVHESKGALVHAIEDSTAAGVLEPQEQQHQARLAQLISQYPLLLKALRLAGEHQWEQALVALQQVPPQQRSAASSFVQLRLNMQLGNPSHVYSSALQALRNPSSPGSWTLNQPRTLAALAGGMASLKLANVDKALKVYQHVLRQDAEQPQVKAAYKRLKKFNKQMEQVEESLHLSFNHKAVGQLDEAAGMLRGLGLASGGAHYVVLLKKCDALSAMKLNDDALEACDAALGMIEEQGQFVDPHKKLAAFRTRARAHSKDNNHEDAVNDLRAAAAIGGGDEVQHQLREAQHSLDQWQKRRDHKVVLELPSNIEELEHGARCMWLKKMYKKMAMKWHPDKAKGAKKRAERKMRESAEAKEELVARWRCKGIR